MSDCRLQGRSSFNGEAHIANIPGDKSLSHRAAIFGSIATNQSTFENFLTAEDCVNTVSIMSALGVPISLSGTTLTVSGVGKDGLKPAKAVLDVGNSGTGIRLLAGLLAGLPFRSEISGDASIQSRPMKRVTDPLSRMGAVISGRMIPDKSDLYPPLSISGGNLSGIWYDMPIASAQVKSALLIAGLFASGKTTVTEPEVCRDHTEKMLAFFGADIVVEGRVKTVSGAKALINPSVGSVRIPSDVSSAAFFLVLGALLPGVKWRLSGIGLNPTRTGVVTLLQMMGAKIGIEPETGGVEEMGTLTIQSSRLKNVVVPSAQIPNLIDELPILAVAAHFASGKFEVRNAAELRVKESDRLAAIVRLIRALGGKIDEFQDGFVIEGTGQTNSFEMDSKGDHRMAMAAVVAGLVGNGRATVKDCDCIRTSFPNFFGLLQGLGFELEAPKWA